MESLQNLFKDHLQICMKNAEESLSSLNYSSLILSSGKPFTYFCDDSEAPFRTNPHFAHWCPAKGPHHFIKYTPGEEKPHLIYYLPQDYWHDHDELSPDLYWVEAFQISHIDNLSQLNKVLGATDGSVFLGNDEEYFRFHKIQVNCELMSARLNWFRRQKSDYEIFCLSQANKIAAQGHLAAKKAFLEGESEFGIYLKYLDTIKCTEAQLPYGAIIGHNQHAGILHYRSKDHAKKATNMLIDAGACFAHYGSDITRSYAHAKHPNLFSELLSATENMQLELCTMVKIGSSFQEISEQTHLKIAEILENLKILNIKNNFAQAVKDG
ncbi:MAG: M24 family metallopeptidase, partial [Silvanigrellaceae bacterium]|nr:M24 family metallopeptidase [Silvanigrellaceae bacterium]